MFGRTSLFSQMSTAFVAAVAVALVFATADVARAQAQVPEVTGEESLAAFSEAVRSADTDAILVDLATALLDARENTQISYDTFRDGIWIFSNYQPNFYGNFFGDPFAATYDASYIKMDRIRRHVGYDVDPRNGLAGMFACNPLTYDPAFDRSCRGFRFAMADFFFLPLRPKPSSFAPDLAMLATSAPRGAALGRGDDGRRGRHGTHQIASSTPATAQPSENTEVRSTDRPGNAVEVPADAAARMQETAATLRRAELERQMREEIEARYGDAETLTPRQRAQVARRFAERQWSRTDTGVFEERAVHRLDTRDIGRRDVERTPRTPIRPDLQARTGVHDGPRSRAEAAPATGDYVPDQVRNAEEEISRSKSESSSDDAGGR